MVNSILKLFIVALSFIFLPLILINFIRELNGLDWLYFTDLIDFFKFHSIRINVVSSDDLEDIRLTWANFSEIMEDFQVNNWGDLSFWDKFEEIFQMVANFFRLIGNFLFLLFEFLELLLLIISDIINNIINLLTLIFDLISWQPDAA